MIYRDTKAAKKDSKSGFKLISEYWRYEKYYKKKKKQFKKILRDFIMA